MLQRFNIRFDFAQFEKHSKKAKTSYCIMLALELRVQVCINALDFCIMRAPQFVIKPRAHLCDFFGSFSNACLYCGGRFE